MISIISKWDVLLLTFGAGTFASKTVIKRVAFGGAALTANYSWQMARLVGTVLLEEALAPAGLRALTQVKNLTLFGSAPAAGVVGGILFFTVAFPLAMSSSEGQPGPDLYTPEIMAYEESVTWSGSGGMLI